MTALFTRDGDEFVPSDLTRGGWNDDHQHGSPPSGLLARAIESAPTSAPMQTVRFVVDLFRPVPLTPLRTTTTVVRDGRRIQVADSALFAGEIQVGRASALKVRTAELALAPHTSTPNSMPAGPEVLQPLAWEQRPGPHDAVPSARRGNPQLRLVVRVLRARPILVPVEAGPRGG
ncbi:MAG TPA: acyl-CoA thioesterase domain-containing protein [Acidimicrobiia bacterium]|nr:acyl-CoA thioesterase domain-containing protein [Acidimicrobiia bacterium]